MKGNKKKINNVPCDYNLWLCRIVTSYHKNHKTNVSEKTLNKGRTSLGLTKTAMKMIKLGYIPKYKIYKSDYGFMRLSR